MFKYLKNKISYIVLAFVFLNINTVYSYEPSRISVEDNEVKVYEYNIMGDAFDDNLNLIINEDLDNVYNMYVLDELTTHDSEYKITKPDDSEEDLLDKNIFNNEVSRLQSKYSELEHYLNSLKTIINDNEKNLILKYLPRLMDDKIYFDVDYNEVSVSDMNIIYNALIKIYDAVKITAKPYVYYEHLGFDNYIYGFNIDFLRSNIKSLKNALNRKEIFKIDKKNIVETKHNRLLDELYYFDIDNGEEIKTRFKIASVSSLIDDTYYNVMLEPVDNFEIEIDSILYELKENDIIKIIYKNYEDVMTYQGIEKDTEDYRVYKFYENNGNYYHIHDNYDGSNFIHLDENTNFIVKIYKNAVCLTMHQFLINNYVANDKLDDNFYNNLQYDNNLFDNMDKTGIMVTNFDFDEKGYVKSLIDIKGQYE